VRQPQIPEVPIGLRREFAEGRVVLFIGAGVSMAVDAPGWEGLVKRLISTAKLRGTVLRRLSLEQTISLFIGKRGGRKELREILRAELDRPRDLVIHEALVSLPVSVILTTNYDPHLSEAATKLRISHEVIHKDCEIPQKFERRDLTIIHLYGNTEDPLASEEDLINFEREHPAFSSILQHVLLTRTVFFLGFSFRDYNVLNHILRTRTMMRVEDPQNFVPTHYAYMVDSDPSLFSDLWAQRQLHVFSTRKGRNSNETSELFRAFVGELSQKVAELTYEEVERERMILRVENDFFESIARHGEIPVMRRESTFSVFALPERFEDSGLRKREGWKFGIDRKRLYEKWIIKGSLRLILNCQPRYWEEIRGYNSLIAVQRLNMLKTIVEENLDNSGLIFGIRRHPSSRQSFASLGNSILLQSDSPPTEGIIYKQSDIVRNRHAIGVFNECFDRELEDLMCDAGAPPKGVDDANAIRKLKVYSLERINHFIAEATSR